MSQHIVPSVISHVQLADTLLPCRCCSEAVDRTSFEHRATFKQPLRYLINIGDSTFALKSWANGPVHGSDNSQESFGLSSWSFILVSAPNQHSKLRPIASVTALIACGVGLCIAFPDYLFCTLFVVTAFFLDQLADASFRPFLWALIGSVVAYLAMTLAFYVRQFAFPYQIPHLGYLFDIGHSLLRFTAAFAPLLFLTKFYRPGSRRLAFVSLCALLVGSLGYYSRGLSTSWLRTLWMEYSSLTWGCCAGAVIGTLIVGVYDTCHPPQAPNAS